MSAEPGLLDANVLAYAVNADAPQHTASRALLEGGRSTSTALYVTSQILCELYSVITNPRRVAVASSPTEALRVITALLAVPGLHVLPIPASAVIGWMKLLQRIQLRAERYPELVLINPLVTTVLESFWDIEVAGCGKSRPHSRTTGEDACPTTQNQQLASRVGQASSPVGTFFRSLLLLAWPQVSQRRTEELEDRSVRILYDGD